MLVMGECQGLGWCAAVVVVVMVTGSAHPGELLSLSWSAVLQWTTSP